jgi:hypothetical protein
MRRLSLTDSQKRSVRGGTWIEQGNTGPPSFAHRDEVKLAIVFEQVIASGISKRIKECSEHVHL